LLSPSFPYTTLFRSVHTLFTLVSPTVSDHLYLLSRLAFALRDPAFKAAVARHAPSDEILRESRRVEAALDSTRGSTVPFVRNKADRKSTRLNSSHDQ